MERFNAAIMYLLSFKVYVLLPVIIFVLALVFGIRVKTAAKAALTLGIGFIGIFMTFGYYVGLINPAIKALVTRSGLSFTVLDTGWIPLSVLAWQFHLAPLLLVLFLGVNAALLAFRKTRTVDIDIWNYWHVIFVSATVFAITGSNIIAIAFGIGAFILVLKLSDWSAPLANRHSGLSGICIPHLSGLAYYPIGVAGNALLDRIPWVNKLNANPERMKEKLGLLGEPMAIGFIVGAGLAVAGGYSFKAAAELAVGFAGVIYILPIMCGILGSALIPVSEGMKVFIAKRFPDMGTTFIGLDVAVLFGIPAVMVTTVLLIPFALLFAFILPGVKFIPLGDLTNLTVPIALIALATGGNVIRSFIIGIPVVIGNLYCASALAPLFTRMATAANYHVEGYSGVFTSFLDGGNLLRAWLAYLASGNWIAIAATPVVAALVWYARKVSKRAP
ncbi:MAG TPA: PTS transporter subunit IIC [Treponemataceae bacterium]|nr:PTS transporter subunit IIC [Treponemataceae bacterium]HPS43446.1 PTS transporter subunit IIC [Treponemataceae bacterium]